MQVILKTRVVPVANSKDPLVSWFSSCKNLLDLKKGHRQPIERDCKITNKTDWNVLVRSSLLENIWRKLPYRPERVTEQLWQRLYAQAKIVIFCLQTQRWITHELHPALRRSGITVPGCHSLSGFPMEQPLEDIWFLLYHVIGKIGVDFEGKNHEHINQTQTLAPWAMKGQDAAFEKQTHW